MGPVDEKPNEAIAPEASSAATAEISREIVRLHSNLFGRGPTKAKTVWTDEIVTCVLRDAFTRAETVLADSGRFDRVRSNRQAFNDEVAPRLNDIVEAATG